MVKVAGPKTFDASILGVDIKGYSEMHARRRRAAQKLIDRLLAEAVGSLGDSVDHTAWLDGGDGGYFVLRGEVTATCKVMEAFVEALDFENEGLPADRQIHVRYAMHCGDVHAFQGKLSPKHESAAINDCARLLDKMNRRHLGQVVCSGAYKRRLVDADVHPGCFTRLRDVVDKHTHHHEVWNVARQPGFGVTPGSDELHVDDDGAGEPEDKPEGLTLSASAEVTAALAVTMTPLSPPFRVSGRVPRPKPLIGREADLIVLGVALAGGGPAAVLLQGGPGLGKTALTQAAAHLPESVQSFGDARIYVELETTKTAEAMADAIIRALGGDPARGLDTALAALGGQRTLLVLDNLETPWDPTAERLSVEALLSDLAATPGLALLASFRGLEPVGGADWTLVHPVQELAPAAAAELFDRIARWQASADPCFADLIRSLGGVPLAIELVAHRAYRRTNLATLWAEWQAIGTDLAAHPDYERGRLTSLPHSIELSLGSARMTDGARHLFRLLGQLPAGLCAEDRDALLDGSGADAQHRLLRIGLAIERGERVDLLPPIREHAARHHTPKAGDVAAWTERFLHLTSELGLRAGWDGGAQAIARLLPEHPNIEAAIRAMINANQAAVAMSCLHGLERLAYFASISTPVIADLGAACRRVNDTRGEADCLRSSASIAYARSDHDGARQAYEDARQLYQQIEYALGEANCIQGLGDIALARSDHEAAKPAFEEALPLYRQASDILGEANCIKSLGYIAARSDLDEAWRAYDEALQLYRQIGDPLGEANCTHGLGDIALARSDLDEARTAFEEGLLLYRQVGDMLGEANCSFGLGKVALAHSDRDGARKAYKEAHQLYRRVSDILGEANCVRRLGDIMLERSERDGARQAYEEAAVLYRQIGNRLWEEICLKKLEDLPPAQL